MQQWLAVAVLAPAVMALLQRLALQHRGPELAAPVTSADERALGLGQLTSRAQPADHKLGQLGEQHERLLVPQLLSLHTVLLLEPVLTEPVVRCPGLTAELGCVAHP